MWLPLAPGDVFESIGIGKYECKDDGSIVRVDDSTEITNGLQFELETGNCWYYDNAMMFQCSAMDDKRIVKVKDYVSEAVIAKRIHQWVLANGYKEESSD